MKIAYFDTIGGIAGDMTMAAFVSAGLPLDELSRNLNRLPVGGFELLARHVRRNSVDAVHIEVSIQQEPRLHRNLHGIYDLIDRSELSARVKQRAKAIFTVIAEAEAKVHNTPVAEVHFHEVGALDSIVDIIGVSICLEHFGIERVYSSPVRLGSGGLVQTQHGLMPSPSPAALEILKEYPVVLTSMAEELTTPTGAAIIKALSTGVLDEEIIQVHAIGYGAGSKEFSGVPNFLRIVIGDLPVETESDTVAVVETNIDDMNPQLYPVLIDRLLKAGAHDAYLVPIIMKKGRPGILLSVMADKSRLEDVVGILYRETSTIGVRVQHIGRRKLPRRHLEVRTSFGMVKAKVVLRDGREIITPEFEECKRIAAERHLPLPEIIRCLEREIGPP
jgi:uncharacterized protein (TIGR00299 family) protein